MGGYQWTPVVPELPKAPIGDDLTGVLPDFYRRASRALAMVELAMVVGLVVWLSNQEFGNGSTS